MPRGQSISAAGFPRCGHPADQHHPPPTRGRPRLATGAASGLIAVLAKAVLTSASDSGVGGVFATWWTYLLILTVPVGFLLLQSALQAGRLVASQPGITLANPLVAAGWGIGIFDEDVRTGGWLIGALLGAMLIGAGAVLLSRSSLLQQQPPS